MNEDIEWLRSLYERGSREPGAPWITQAYVAQKVLPALLDVLDISAQDHPGGEGECPGCAAVACALTAIKEARRAEEEG